MSVYLRANFQLSSITLTSFRLEGGGYFTPPAPQNEPLKSVYSTRLKQDHAADDSNFYDFVAIYLTMT